MSSLFKPKTSYILIALCVEPTINNESAVLCHSKNNRDWQNNENRQF